MFCQGPHILYLYDFVFDYFFVVGLCYILKADTHIFMHYIIFLKATSINVHYSVYAVLILFYIGGQCFSQPLTIHLTCTV